MFEKIVYNLKVPDWKYDLAVSIVPYKHMFRNLSVTYKYHTVHATAAELQEELINQFSSPKMHVKVFNTLTFPLKFYSLSVLLLHVLAINLLAMANFCTLVVKPIIIMIWIVDLINKQISFSFNLNSSWNSSI